VMVMTRGSSAPRAGNVAGLLFLLKSLCVAHEAARRAVRHAHRRIPNAIALHTSKTKACKVSTVLLQYALRRETSEITTRSVSSGSRGVEKHQSLATALTGSFSVL